MQSPNTPRRLADILEQQGVGATITEDIAEPVEPGVMRVLAGSLPEGWVVQLNGAQETSPAPGEAGDGLRSLALLTDAELFGTVKERRYRRTRKAEGGPDIVLSDLVPGSFVVHVDHGVARFAGTTRLGHDLTSGDSDDKEYLVLEYADKDKLYVPTDHLDRVSSYIGAQDQSPALTRLNTAEWARIKEKVKGATRELAEDLLKLHAASPDRTRSRLQPRHHLAAGVGRRISL